ncbi:unnamed protein product [Adineta steineri]|uniref:Uncharacterized protein n=1 Tax=Adineta steineri TaxID=433720 RepID=A0A813TYI8_9BILA|nr:unnamed protein product [Adineta steineri]
MNCHSIKYKRQLDDLETQIPPVVERLSQNLLWLIGLSITAGVILLIILVGVLWCCGFFKRNRPQYPVSARDDIHSHEDQFHLSSSYKPGKIAFQPDSDETSSDDNEIMIQNAGDSLPIVIPQNSSHFIQQQQQKAPYIF